MANVPSLSGISAKRIPTVLGLIILVVALILGTVFFQQGLGVFAPRATPETTPKQIRITNVTDSSFTVSFMTDSEVAGFVRYGTEEKSLKKTAVDDRDTLTNTTGSFKMHHITLRGLEPNTTYFYVLGTGDGALFDNNSVPFKIITARRGGTPSSAKTIHGSVLTESGAPAEGAVVYISSDGMGEMSSLIKSSGGWAVPLSNARTKDGSQYAKITDETSLQILVQGPNLTQTARGVITVAQFNEWKSVPTITYGQTSIVAETAMLRSSEETEEEDAEAIADSSDTDTVQAESTQSSASASLLQDTETERSVTATASTVVDLSLTETQTVSTTQPTITGKAAPNVTITIQVNSETKITQQLTAAADGSFSLDIAALQQQLEPGEHTVTYSYTDPNSGEVITRTERFYVSPQATSATVLAQATPRPTPTPTPFGTDNPFPITGATTSATATSAATTATASSTATSSVRKSQPSTTSAMPVSGSVGTTMALIFGGLFFIISGTWSFWVSKNYSSED